MRQRQGHEVGVEPNKVWGRFGIVRCRKWVSATGGWPKLVSATVDGPNVCFGIGNVPEMCFGSWEIAKTIFVWRVVAENGSSSTLVAETGLGAIVGRENGRSPYRQYYANAATRYDDLPYVINEFVGINKHHNNATPWGKYGLLHLGNAGSS